jgi:transposase
VRRAPERYAFLFQDECEFHLNPGLARMWSPKGQQPTVPSAGQNRRVPVFGGLDARTGTMTFLVTKRKRGADFIEFVRLVLRRYAGRHVFLFLDNSSVHTSKAVRRFLADHRDRITPIWNATYAPQLNLIERYWGHLKAKALNNYFFGDVEALEAAVREAIHAFNRSRELRLHLSLDALHTFREAA